VKEGILNKQAMLFIGVIGLWISIVTLGIFYWALSEGFTEKEAVTLFFVTLIFARLFNAYNCRSFSISSFKVKYFSNKSLLWGIFISIISTLIVVYAEPLQIPFHTRSIPIMHWAAAIAAASTTLFVVEILKLYQKRKQA